MSELEYIDLDEIIDELLRRYETNNEDERIIVWGNSLDGDPEIIEIHIGNR